MKYRTAALMLSAALLLSGCSSNGGESAQTDGESSVSNTSAVITRTDLFSDEDYDASWDEASATMITLNGSSASVSGTGAAASGSTVTITNAGTYVLSGSFKGQIVINANSTDTVRLVLNGATISYAENAAIYASQADKVILILAEGTENSVTDGTGGSVTLGTDDPDGAIYVQDDLTITGSGSLTVTGNVGHGIITKDDLRITGGTLDITAVKTALRGRDSIAIADGNITLNAGTNALHSNNDGSTDKGFIVIDGGTFNITSAGDGIQAVSTLEITGGSFNITTTEGADNTSYKAVKSDGNMTISGGSFTIDSVDDAFHSNGSITVSDGTFTINTGDDGFHADEDMTISGGNVQILSSYEGIEGSNVYITGGEIDIVSSDDAINAAGGSSSDTNVGRFGADSFGGSGDYSLNVSGGTIRAIAGGDGFDSNGSLTISGGYSEVYISSTPDNEALDCDGALTISGGTVIYGGTGTGGTDTSTQSYVALTNLTANTEVTVSKDGTEVVTFTPTIDCSYLVVSTPVLATDEVYQVTIAGESSDVTAGTGAQSGMMGMGGGQGGPGGQGGFGGQDGEMPSGEMPSFEDGEMPSFENGEAPSGDMQQGGRGGMGGGQGGPGEQQQATE